MPDRSPNVRRLEVVAEALGPLLDQVTFTGGATLEFYLPEAARSEIRPTKDVDCIITAATKLDYQKFEETLRLRGFRNDSSAGAPICRWMFKSTIVDFMPQDEKALGFTNRWFRDALKSSITVALPSGKEIRICSLPAFFAVKCEAFLDRGVNYPRTSTDLEDIATVVALNPNTANEISRAPDNMKDFVQTTFGQIAHDVVLSEAFQANCPGGQGTEAMKTLLGIAQQMDIDLQL